MNHVFRSNINQPYGVSNLWTRVASNAVSGVFWGDYTPRSNKQDIIYSKPSGIHENGLTMMAQGVSFEYEANQWISGKFSGVAKAMFTGATGSLYFIVRAIDAELNEYLLYTGKANSVQLIGFSSTAKLSGEYFTTFVEGTEPFVIVAEVGFTHSSTFGPHTGKLEIGDNNTSGKYPFTNYSNATSGYNWFFDSLSLQQA